MARNCRISPWMVMLALVLAGGCSDDGVSPPPSDTPSRSYRMGFSGIPPRAELPLVIATIDLWSPRSDAAIMSFEPPWDSLLAGVPPETLVVRDHEQLANYYRFKGHEIWIYLDPGNGLDRAGESDALVAAGRSIEEPEIQQMFRRYAVVIDSIVRPAHLGLALETNLIRGISPAPLYAAIRQVVNAAAADVRAIDAAVTLSVSLQVDYAWGRLIPGPFRGVDQDFADFPFVQEVGLSSYPYLGGFDVPEDIPADYYSGLLAGRTIPAAVTEGGWSSATLDSLVSSEDEQKRYIQRQSVLLDRVNAIAVFQLTFTDLDLGAINPPPGSILYLFARNGLVDVNLNPKAALAAWDARFARPLR